MRKNLILLAAGYSKRFHGTKLLAEYRGRPLYQTAIEKLLWLCENRTDSYLCVVAACPQICVYCEEKKIPFIRNEGSDNTGIASSIQKAVLFLREEETAGGESCDVFFTADMPLLDLCDVNAFLDAYDLSGHTFGTMSCDGVWRSPNIFRASARDELLSLSGDCGGKAILKRHAADVFCYETANQEQFFDIDTREDLSALSDGIISSHFS